MSTDNIDLLSNRVNSLESRFDSHSKKVEDKLDQLVEILKLVALLQERQQKNTETIDQIRLELKDAQKFDHEAVIRLHTRVDQVLSEVIAKEKSLIDKTNSCEKAIHDKIATLDEKSNDINKEMQKWLNRAVGAFFAGSVLIGVIQSIGFWYIDTLKSEHIQSQKSIQDITSRISNIEESDKEFWSQIRALKEAVKK